MTEVKLRFGSTSVLSELADAFRHAPTAGKTLDKPWARRYQSRLVVTDSVVVLAASAAANVAASAQNSSQLTTYSVATGLAMSMIWLVMLAALHTRDRRIFGTQATEYRRVVAATSSAFGLVAILTVLFDVPGTRDYFVVALPLGLLALLVNRKAWRESLTRARARGRSIARAVVIGDPVDTRYVINQIQQHSASAFTIVGAVNTGDSARHAIDEVPVLGGYTDVAEAARAVQADTVIVASQPHGGGDIIRNLSWQLEGTATDLVLASRLTDVAGPRIHFRPIEGLPLIHVEIPQFDGAKHVAKRIFDVIASALGLIAALPIMAVVALIIEVDDRGPVFYRQERVGRNETTFTMYKFRSMAADAEQRLDEVRKLNEGSGALFKMKNDPRVTRVGRWIRKYSLDELPQLWNVLIGDMSLVGPRPPLRSEVETYEEHVHRRLYIKPGLTGMWQIGGRSNLSWEESVRLDLYYVENWSLVGDFVILWRTVRVLLNPIGAY